MNYVFFSIIILSITTSLVYRKKNMSIIMLMFILIFLIMKYPQISVNSARDGINLWLFIVLPSLLPFFMINDMLISLKVPDNLSRLFAPFARILFNTSGFGAYVFIMSIFSGYPTGAKITSDLIENKKISPSEGQKILSFSSTSGPLFIVGVIGASMLKSTSAGYILISAHILGAIINGIVFSFILGRDNKNDLKLEKVKSKSKPISEILTTAIINSFYTGVIIGGYIILFSVVISLLNKIEFFKIISFLLSNALFIPIHIANLIGHFLEASLEISNGTKIISDLSIQIDQKLILLSFIVAFSGLSIIGQVASLISKSKISLNIYILSKLTHGIISSILCYLFIYYNFFSIQTSKTEYSSNPNIFSQPVLLEILLFTILLLNLLYRELVKLKYSKFYKNNNKT
jgi:sporulation integral membrane protein YlbJ